MKRVGGSSAPGTGSGAAEIATALAESRRLFVAIGVFSAFVNLLMLTGPIFMLQVYDRVLTSRSEATLVTLVVITAFLFLMMGILDHARGRVLARAETYTTTAEDIASQDPDVDRMAQEYRDELEREEEQDGTPPPAALNGTTARPGGRKRVRTRRRGGRQAGVRGPAGTE